MNKEQPKQETIEEAAERYSANQLSQLGFINGAKWQQQQNNNLYSEEDMIKASEYGYNFHKTTQFPEQEFQDSCIRNTQQWLTTFKKK